jgi:hypothetical protein
MAFAVGLGALMTIVVTAKVTDGLVLAADSASTFTGPGTEMVVFVVSQLKL